MPTVDNRLPRSLVADMEPGDQVADPDCHAHQGGDQSEASRGTREELMVSAEHHAEDDCPDDDVVEYTSQLERIMGCLNLDIHERAHPRELDHEDNSSKDRQRCDSHDVVLRLDENNRQEVQRAKEQSHGQWVAQYLLESPHCLVHYFLLYNATIRDVSKLLAIELNVNIDLHTPFI